MIALTYTYVNNASRVKFEAFTLVKPLNVVGVRVSCGLEVEFLHHAYRGYVGTTPTIND